MKPNSYALFINTEHPNGAMANVDIILDEHSGDRIRVVILGKSSILPTLGYPATLSLRIANGFAQVFTGAIAAIEPGLTTTRITAHGTAHKLLRTYLNHSYERMSAGAIARDLAQKAGLDVASAEEGITFPAYVIDERRSAFHHLHDIAALCGFDCYCNAAGQLVFQAFKGGNTVHVLEYGTHILQLDIQQTSPSVTQFEAWGESPGGSRGDKAWSWLTKDFTPSHGLAGDGTPSRLLERAVLRTADAARLAAQAAQAASIRRSLRGRVLLPGRPEIQLGDAIRLAQLPNPDLNASFQVSAITHRLSRRHGFTTAVDFQRIP